MKRLSMLISALMIVFSASAQQPDSSANTIYIGDGTDTSISTRNGNISLSLAGMNLEFVGRNDAVEEGANAQSSCVSFSGFDARNNDHLSLFEVGVNMLTDVNYSLYSDEERAMLPFANRKSTYFALNLFAMDVRLTKSGSLGFEMGVGFSCVNFEFAVPYSLKYDGAVMRPITLEGNIKESELHVDYIHMPFILNWNFSKKFFVAAGVNLDIAYDNTLRYRKPRTTISGTVTINPIQVGATARIGYGKLYGFVNYSFMDFFKSGTGPGGKALSAGVGLFF